MISAMKFTVPGMPTDAMQATKKQPATKGMRLTSPPNSGIWRECVWS